MRKGKPEWVVSMAALLAVGVAGVLFSDAGPQIVGGPVGAYGDIWFHFVTPQLSSPQT